MVINKKLKVRKFCNSIFLAAWWRETRSPLGLKFITRFANLLSLAWCVPTYKSIVHLKRFTSLLIVLFFSTAGLAQEYEKLPLQKILQVLEQRYAVTFTYTDNNIKGISFEPPPQRMNLKETLLYLQQLSGLIFQQLNERYITISKPMATARSICGVISFADIAQPVSGATIQCGSGFAVSSESGYFELNIFAQDSIAYIRFTGCEPMAVSTTELTNRPCHKISLHPQPIILQEVFVKDFIAKGINKKMDGSFVINAANLSLLPGLTEPDVLQAIQALPGSQSINETISDINIRGGTNDQNLILWDGIKMYHSGHFFSLISAFSPYLTEKVTLIKNGTTAALGDGTSCTIDIRTDNYVAEKFTGGAGLNMINGDVFAKIPVSKKISLQISARRSVVDILKTPTYKQYFKRAFSHTDVTTSPTDTLLPRREKFYFYDVSFKFLYDITPKDKLRVSFLNVFNNIDYEEKAIINSVTQTKTSGLDQRNIATGLNYSRLWSDKVRTSAQVSLSAYEVGAVNFDLFNDQRLEQQNNVLDAGIKLDTRIRIGNHTDLFTGYQFFEVGITNFEEINNPSFRRSIKKVMRTHAVFIESNFDYDKTNIRLGIRGNYLPEFQKIMMEPRITFNQNFLKHFYFEVLAEMKNQSSTQIIDLQTDFLGLEKRRWALSNNQEIPIINSRQLSTGLYYKKDNLLVSVEGFYKQVENIITSSQAFQNQFQYTRANGNYQTTGIDFLMNKKFNRFTTWISYSNAKSNFDFKQLIPSNFPNNLDIRHRVALGCSYQAKQFEISAGANWQSGKPFTEPVKLNEIVNNEINYKAPNSARLGNYLRIDASAKYTFALSDQMKGLVGISVWNVPNRQNIINTYYYLNANNQVQSVEQTGLGITPNVIFRVSF